MNRREFVASAAAGAAFSTRAAGAGDKVNVAVIGIRGQGRGLTARFAAQPDVNIVALCDIDPRVYGPAAKLVEQAQGKRPPLVTDLRRVLDDNTVDAVVIATPDHWHAPATILACDAGKDVYVEKPASHNLREGRLMVKAARRNQRIVQLGTQSRSRPSTLRAIEFIRSGRIGRVLMAKAWNVQLREHIGHKPDSPVPGGVEYDTWIGPAPFLPFNENRFHYKWHWHWNFGTGDIGNDGVHQMDIARWALGVELPFEVSGMGRKLFFDDDQQTPDTMTITYNFTDKVLMFEMRIWNSYGMEGQDNGVAVYGTTGMVHIGRWNRKWGYKVYDAKGKLVEDESAGELDNDVAHARNFLDCVKSRKAPHAEIEIGHISSSLCHLGNLVARTGRRIKYDAAVENIPGDAEAARLLGREYRKHWAVPKATA
ncbi:MAG: Gfo/Idh/MocA family oxidoreductase [Acidobacteria bacterium]|nr:Gfo/Idh/MocA family oxidoreductase [Acidobacteriota bacterium]